MRYVIAVRALCEFTAKQGDLDLRFTPSPSAEEGRIGHRVVASRRHADYQTEISVTGEFQELTVRGRADGYDPQRGRLEEIKTYRGELDTMPDNHRALHWAQLRVYGWLFCQQAQVPSIELGLVYYDIATGHETVLTETASAAELKAAFEQQCARFIEWAVQERAHRAARDAMLHGLQLPFPAFRVGQRELAEAVYRAARGARVLLAQAPTGIGKTLGTLFPLLKACPRASIDKVFFLSAKSPGRQLALDSLQSLMRGAAGSPRSTGSAAESTRAGSGMVGRTGIDMRVPGSPPALPLRVVELVARDKACEYPGNACTGQACTLAQGFYDRLPAAREAALAKYWLDRGALREVGLTHRVCPYYLGQELVRWADVIVGDYNYYFDTGAPLFALTVQNQWRVAVLVDEAHNLPERARAMYSATLEQEELAQLTRGARGMLGTALRRLQRCWNTLNRAQAEPYRAFDVLPDAWLCALQRTVGAIGEHLAEPQLVPNVRLERFYLDAIHFLRIAERFDEHWMFDVTLTTLEGSTARATSRSTLCIRNVVPAAALRARVVAAHSMTLFSATLWPARFYRDVLGLPDSTVNVDVDSPFSKEQLAVYATSSISTRYRDRQASLGALVERIASQYAALPGNYLCFFSSFEYLEQAAALFSATHPLIPVWRQARAMDEPAQRAFIARFEPHGRGIGFAVLGGAFAEGIDLPGTRLVGTFIATLGMPQINAVNEQLRERMQRLFSAGFDYTYLFPGVQKVVQAAGRVIRSETDRGVVHLLDDRFMRRDVRALLPRWWKVEPESRR
ncbi:MULTISPECIES: ATP-dependent DNA helicase [Mycetohabitans]|uniref:ATP-dependent DNA helicase n=1 Tax=Mycetohabitans TaxID=2571159 RepID=UPI001F314131|nr:ATP-dependent DNA helicase [Mycetohabitans sp. B3]MCF2133652.1 ATP-dependent DNA helicase [Mycetohabitans sp. B3]